MFFISLIYRKKSFLLLFFISVSSFSQQIGDGVATYINDFSLPLKSGLYQGSNPIGATPDLSHPWQHLFVLRHSETTNNHQLQIGSSYNTNDRLFFRKIAAGLQSSNPEWIEVATRGANVFSGNQIISGRLNIGSNNISPQTKLHVIENGSSVNIWRGRIVASGDINSVVMGEYNGKAWLGAHNSQLTGWSDLILQADGGFLGIGTPNPSSKLDVRGTIKSYEPVSLSANLNSFQMINEIGGSVGENSVMNRIWFLRDASSNNWYSSRIHDGISVDASFGVPHVDTRTWWERDPLDNIQSWGNSGATYLTINNGNVGIGTTSPAHKLDVIGTIRSREVKVDMNGADFVFEEKYPLMPLSELETYIKKNKHLPEIAPAKEMQEQGSNLGDLNTKLLQKIEELTLYTIEQNKNLELQNKKLQLQNEKINRLEQKLTTLEAKTTNNNK